MKFKNVQQSLTVGVKYNNNSRAEHSRINWS